MSAVLLAPAALFLAAAAGYVLSNRGERRGLKIATKPLVMPLLILLYILAAPRPQGWVLAALGAAFVGDVALIWPQRRGLFALGLGAFLVGHAAYLVALVGPVWGSGAVPVWFLVSLLPFAAFGAAAYRALAPRLGSMRRPVLAYMSVILAMSFASLLRVWVFAGLPFWLPLAGSLLFVASDTLLACERFTGPVPPRGLLVAVFYVAAQVLIVLGFLAQAGAIGGGPP